MQHDTPDGVVALIWLCEELQFAAKKGHVIQLGDVLLKTLLCTYLRHTIAYQQHLKEKASELSC